MTAKEEKDVYPRSDLDIRTRDPFPLRINFLVSPYDSPGNDHVYSKFKGRWTCLGCGRLNPGMMNSVPPIIS